MDANFCGGCGTRRELPEGRDFTIEDDPWGDRRLEAEDREQDVHEREQDVLAGMGTRTGTWFINALVPGLLGWIPFLGVLIWLAWMIGSLVLFRRGQDVGAAMLGLRVMRDNGEVAGFYHIWSRYLASILSAIPLYAGFWTAYADANSQTWHDKIMGTYVIKDNPSARERPGTSSRAAKVWFWISIAVMVAFMAMGVMVLTWAISDWQ